jgi:hypothetical protein
VAKNVVGSLMLGGWGLERARQTAREITSNRQAVKVLVEAMFGDQPELRKRAADVARRITDADPQVLWKYADELAGLLAELSPEEPRTRWHLGLVVARVAHTREQRLRAARLMELLIEDESNAARCAGVEGIALLARDEPSLRGVAEEIIERALRDGAKAMKCRARHAKRSLEKARKLAGDLG